MVYEIFKFWYTLQFTNEEAAFSSHTVGFRTNCVNIRNASHHRGLHSLHTFAVVHSNPKPNMGPTYKGSEYQHTHQEMESISWRSDSTNKQQYYTPATNTKTELTIKPYGHVHTSVDSTQKCGWLSKVTKVTHIPDLWLTHMYLIRYKYPTKWSGLVSKVNSQSGTEKYTT